MSKQITLPFVKLFLKNCVFAKFYKYTFSASVAQEQVEFISCLKKVNYDENRNFHCVSDS